MVWKDESLVGHRVAQIKFDQFLDLLSFSLWLCATKMQKKHQQLSNLEIYSDQHYTNSLQQQSIVISHYADNYRWMYYDCLLLRFLFYHLYNVHVKRITFMSVISEVTLYCIPFTVFNILNLIIWANVC